MLTKIRIRFTGKNKDAKYYNLQTKKNVSKKDILKLSKKEKIIFQKNPNDTDSLLFIKKRKFLIHEIANHNQKRGKKC